MSIELFLLAGVVTLVVAAGAVRLRRQWSTSGRRPSAFGPEETETRGVSLTPAGADAAGAQINGGTDSPRSPSIPQMEETEAIETVHVPFSAGMALRSAITSVRGSGSPVLLLGIAAYGINLLQQDRSWLTVAGVLARWVLMAGGIAVALHSLRGEDPGPERLLDGLRNAHRVLGASLLVGWPAIAAYAFAFASMLTLGWMLPHVDFTFPLVPEVYGFLRIASVAVVIAGMVYVIPRLYMAFSVAVDVDTDTRDTARRAVALLRGNMGRTLVLFSVLSLAAMLALRLSPIAFLFTEPLIVMVSAATYEQLRTAGATTRIA